MMKKLLVASSLALVATTAAFAGTPTTPGANGTGGKALVAKLSGASEVPANQRAVWTLNTTDYVGPRTGDTYAVYEWVSTVSNVVRSIRANLGVLLALMKIQRPSCMPAVCESDG